MIPHPPGISIKLKKTFTQGQFLLREHQLDWNSGANQACASEIKKIILKITITYSESGKHFSLFLLALKMAIKLVSVFQKSIKNETELQYRVNAISI